MHDPIVEEIHKIREKILEECDGDLDKYFDRLKAGNAKYGDRLITIEEFKRLKDRQSEPALPKPATGP